MVSVVESIGMRWRVFPNVPIRQIHWFHPGLMVVIPTMDHTDIHVEQVLLLIDLFRRKFHLKEDAFDHLHRNT